MNFSPCAFLLVLTALLLACTKPAVLETKHENGKIKERYGVITSDGVELRHGKYERFDMEGRLEEESWYEKGKLEGIRKLYMNGILQSEETRKLDRYHGPFKAYFPDGKVQLEANYVDDVMVGTVKVFYPGGGLKELVTFADNVENGPFIEYYENGKLKAEGSYKQLDGPVEDGELKLYDSTGLLLRKMNCEMGKCTTTWQRDTSTIH